MKLSMQPIKDLKSLSIKDAFTIAASAVFGFVTGEAPIAGAKAAGAFYDKALDLLSAGADPKGKYSSLD